MKILRNASTLDATSESNSGTALVCNLVMMEKSSRMLAKDALQHPWFTDLGTNAPLTVHGKDTAMAATLSSLGLGLARAFCLLSGIRGYHGIKWLGPQLRKSMDILRGHAAGFKEWGARLAEAYDKESAGKPNLWACHVEGRHKFYSGGATMMMNSMEHSMEQSMVPQSKVALLTMERA